MTVRNVGLASLAGLGLLSAFWLGRTSVPVGTDVRPLPASEIAAPEQSALLDEQSALLDEDGAEVEAMQARSRELAAEVASLQAEIVQLLSLRQEAASLPPAAAPTTGRTQSAGGKRWLDAPEFDASELLENGVPPSEVERLRELFDEIETERIAIMQQALREGWLDKRRYRDEMVELQRATREAIGDDRYDALLYATGEKNRVKIRVLLENSPNRSVGFEVGDVVLMYDGHLVFRPPELRETARLGEPGEWVTVDVLRNGEVVRLRGERGPIRARLQPTRILPDAFW